MMLLLLLSANLLLAHPRFAESEVRCGRYGSEPCFFLYYQAAVRIAPELEWGRADREVYSGAGLIYSEKQRLFSLLFAGCRWQKSRISAVSAEALAVFPWKNSDNSDGPDRWREGDWRWSW
jgi:hypothetical protein